MNRRRFIGSFSAVMASSALAGCGDLQEEDPTEDTKNDTGDSQTNTQSETDQDGADEQAQARYDEAIDLLVVNQNELDRLQSEDAVRDATEIEQMRERLTDVEIALDDAAEHSDLEFQDKVETARDILEFQSLVVESHDIEIQMVDSFVSADILITSTRFQEAADELERGREFIDEGRSLYEEIETVHARLDTADIDEPPLAYDDEYIDYLRLDSRSVFDGLDAFVNGYAELSRGLGILFEGVQAFDVGDYTNAESSFQDARENFEDATGHISSIHDIEDLPLDFDQFVIELVAFGDTITDAATTFVDAAQAGGSGDAKVAKSLYEEAFSLLREAMEDFNRGSQTIPQSLTISQRS